MKNVTDIRVTHNVMLRRYIVSSLFSARAFSLFHPPRRSYRRYMGVFLTVGLIGFLAFSFTVSAAGINASLGEHYTDVSVGMGDNAPGLYSQLNWAHSDNDGDGVGLSLGLGLPLGDVVLSGGGKALYLHPKHGDDGMALAVGAGLAWSMLPLWCASVRGYYAPDSLSSGVEHYQEMTAELQWQIMRPLSVSVGYRYIDLAGKSHYRDNVIADGLYLGAGVTF